MNFKKELIEIKEIKYKQKLFHKNIKKFKQNFHTLCEELLTKNFDEDYDFLYDNLYIEQIETKEDFEEIIEDKCDSIGDCNYFDVETDCCKDDPEYDNSYRVFMIDELWRESTLTEKKKDVEWYNRADRYRMDSVIECMNSQYEDFKALLFTKEEYEKYVSMPRISEDKMNHYLDVENKMP